MDLYQDLERILFTKEEIHERVMQMGEQISRDYAGADLLLVGILKGAVIFYADLARAISVPLQMDFMSISSYGVSAQTTGEVRILKDLDQSIYQKDVLIVEDIVDTGLTLQNLVKTLSERQVNSLKLCCLLDKPSRRKVNLVPDYIGFQIPDAFAVGYGLDYAQRYRHLPVVGVLKPSVYQ